MRYIHTLNAIEYSRFHKHTFIMISIMRKIIQNFEGCKNCLQLTLGKGVLSSLQFLIGLTKFHCNI